MCTRPVSVRLPPNPYEYSQGIRSSKIVQVPCGKCPECLGKRQKDIALRAYREALKFGSCWFSTLTYNGFNIPFAQSILDIDKSTGDVLIHKVPELCCSSILDSLRREYHSHFSGKVFYKYIDLCDFENHLYQVVYTPTLYYSHVRLLIKNFRVKYFREFNEKLNFTYICVGEYGSKKSVRPHYHVLFFGLTEFQVKYFNSMWQNLYGNAYLESVNFRNSDGSDGLARVASYIGKYSAKGCFNPDSVLQHLTIPCRVSSSRGLGLSNLDNLISYYRCEDLVGKYDIEKIDYKKPYPLEKFYDVLFNRLTYNFNGTKISLPLSFRRKIFGYKVISCRACWSRLYYQVMDFARTKYQDLLDREFREFCSSHNNRPISEVVNDFERLRQNSLFLREKVQKERLSKFYSQSKF